MDLTEQTATELGALIFSKKVSITEIHDAFEKKIRKIDSFIQAWAQLDFDYSRKKAHELDVKMFSENTLEKLHGIPIGIKDIFNTDHFLCEMGSNIWRGFKPGNDARAVFDLRQAGALILGKTQTSEFAVHEPTATCNPRDLRRAPGTSSGGSVAAVTSGMVPVAISSQTAGSTIRPASYCGIYGFKPTFGMVPRTGILKTTDTLDTVAWVARSVEDIELLFETIRVKGLNYPIVHEKVQKKEFPRKLKIGFFKGANWKFSTQTAQNKILETIRRLEASGVFEVIEFELHEFQEIFDSHEIIYCKALSYYFKGEVRNRGAEITQVLAEMLERGGAITSEGYQKEIERQARLTHLMEEKIPCDVWLTLSAGGEAPIGLRSLDRPDSCKIWTYLGMPALTVPAMVADDGMPLGLQIVAKKYRDYDVIETAKRIAEILKVHCSISAH